MIYNYPFFYFPHSNNYSPNYYQRNCSNKYSSSPVNSIYVNNSDRHNLNNVNSFSDFDKKKMNEQYKKHSKYSNNNILSNLFNQNDRDEKEKFIEILGIRLYYDDILLICLIFFLYKEDVKDTYLFIALILLLLS